MRSQALPTRTPVKAQTAVLERAAVIPATGLASDEDGLRIRAIFSLPATWWRRSRFRAELRADIRDKPELLRDIGIGVYEAQAEVSRYFWEALILERR
jgi:uncharacterized protein YjiS (DUF1127 family)